MKKLILTLLTVAVCTAGAHVATAAINGGEPVTVTQGDELRLAIFPNPNKGEQLQVTAGTLNPRAHRLLEITILDRAGQRFLQETFRVGDVEQFVEKIDLKGIQEGMYTVKVVVGQTVLHQRLFIKF